MIDIGAQVVCVMDDWSCGPNALLPFVLPVKGCVYTVRDIYPRHVCDGPMLPEGNYLLLEELRNTFRTCRHCNLTQEPAFHGEYFRPVRKTSIDVFTEILAPVSPKRVRIPIKVETGENHECEACCHRYDQE